VLANSVISHGWKITGTKKSPQILLTNHNTPTPEAVGKSPKQLGWPVRVGSRKKQEDHPAYEPFADGWLGYEEVSATYD